MAWVAFIAGVLLVVSLFAMLTSAIFDWERTFLVSTYAIAFLGTILIAIAVVYVEGQLR